MGFANRFNQRKSTVKEGIDTKKITYVNAKEIAFEGGEPIQLFGYFIQDGKYGESVTLVTETRGINIPKRYVKDFKDLPEDVIEGIKAGELGISAIRPADTDNGPTVFIDFCDIEEDEIPY